MQPSFLGKQRFIWSKHFSFWVSKLDFEVTFYI